MPGEGQTQPLCELYITILRGIIDAQARLIADQARRLAGDPLTSEFVVNISD